MRCLWLDGAPVMGSSETPACPMPTITARVATKRRDEDALDERLQAHRRRMREIDTFVAGSNSRLAREIESLRQD